MSINYITLPKPKDVKVARIYLNWNQEDLAKKCGLNIYAINSLETGRHSPKKETLEKLAAVFLEAGIRFHSEGGFICDREIVRVYEGEDGYSNVKDDIIRTCLATKQEALFLGVDNRKLSSDVVEKGKEMYKLGIECKNLISEDSDFIIGPKECYKKINTDYFLADDVVIIYGNKVAFPFIKDDQDGEIRNIIIKDAGIAKKFKKYFYRIWKKGTPLD